MEPIETRYAGCRFRSRLEARVAVWLDHLRVKWLYEPEGFVVGPVERRRRYLPDFYLPVYGTWLEVKGHDAAVDYGLLVDAADPGHGLPLLLDRERDWPLLHTRIVMVGPLPKWPLFHQSLAVLDGQKVAGQLAALLCDDEAPEHSHRFVGIGQLVRIKSIVEGAPDWEPTQPLANFGAGFPCPDIADAYVAGRSARFEHGEAG